MSFNKLVQRWRHRARRKAYREMVRRWNNDGGDNRFRFDYELRPDSIVLDLGGYEGQWASDLYARQRCRIVIFEPVTKFAEQIKSRFAKNPDIEVVPFALGSNERTETISIAGASSSAYKAKAETTTIRFLDFKQWLDTQEFSSIALMKINIEGGEYELLERIIEAGLADRIENIQVQFHNFVANAKSRMAQIQGALAVTHLPTYQYEFVWENWQRKAARD